MSPNEYQKKAARTLLEKPPRQYTDNEIMLVWNCMGLAGESGELVDNIKKHIFHGHPLDYDKVQKELGDVLWYLTAICTRLGTDLDFIMHKNIRKLEERYPDGFNSQDSINRKENKNDR